MAPVRIDPSLRPGLTFMTLHFPDEVDTNLLTINSTDPKSGTAEFKATAIQGRPDPAGRTRGDSRGGDSRRPADRLMDIVLQNEVPSKGEREAVDSVLGPPESNWDGAERASERDRRVARLGAAARARRHLLLPTLHAVQARAGWISRGALNYICKRLTIPPAEAYGVASFYALFSLEPQPPVVAHICTDVACIADGSAKLCADLAERVGPDGSHRGNGQAIWLESPCLGMCERAPAAMVTVSGEHPEEHSVAPARAEDIATLLAGGDSPEDPEPAIPQFGQEGLRLLGRVGKVDPGEHRLLPRRGRLRGVARRIRHGPGERAARGDGLQAARPRRRRLPRRSQVGRRRTQPQAAALRDLQRRRVRDRHLQGPRDPRARSVLRDRGDDDRRLCNRCVARLPVPARRVSGRVGAVGRRDHRGPRPRVPRRRHPRSGLQLRHRAAQGRRRLHLWRGDRALQLDRGLSRRAAQQAAVPGRLRPVRQADRDQQRRDARQRARDPGRRRRGLRLDRHRGLHRHAAVLPLRPRGEARHLRGALRGHAARGARHGRRRQGRPPAAGGSPRRRGGAVRHAGRARHRDVLRGHARGGGDHGLGRGAGRSTTPWTWRRF